MPLTCNAFAFNTVGTTQQVAVCKAPHVVNLEDHELLPEQFLLLVLDSLQRLVPLFSTNADLSNLTACDASSALRNASCAMLTNTPAYSLTTAQLQAIILWQLNEALC